jgi:uncharacterized protein
MTPGAPAVCDGQVFHRRLTPKVHEFRYPVSYAWLDPDEPDDLCRHHRLWSATHTAPVRFRACDYGDGTDRSLAMQVREDLGRVTGHRPDGPIRMLTQLRRCGWLFNPITLYVAWDANGDGPVGAVLEVTNTPWKQRHRYAVGLVQTGWAGDASQFAARVGKQLHVSPFLDEQFDYVVGLSERRSGGIDLVLTIDVVRPGSDDPVVTTRLELAREPASRQSLGRSLTSHVASTHCVSLGIRLQAVRLWLKRVPFVAHPATRVAHPAKRRVES